MQQKFRQYSSLWNGSIRIDAQYSSFAETGLAADLTASDDV